MTANTRIATIRLGLLAENLSVYRSLAGQRLLFARVDHDAFGHGLVPVAAALVDAGADWLCVADFDEAVRLREAGIDAPLLAFRSSGAVIGSPEVHCAVSTLAEARRALEKGATGVHPIIDCGAAARGIGWASVRTALEPIRDSVPVTGVMGVYGPEVQPRHAAEAFDRALSDRSIGGRAELVSHLHGTRGVESGAPGGSAVRVGRGLYGIPSSADESRGRAVLSLNGTVVTVKEIGAGEGVSYGYIYRAPADGRIALVTGGYADGIYRAAGNRASVIVGGVRRPIIGRVAMDVCVVDLDGAAAAAGDEVAFFGDPADGMVSFREWAVATGLGAAELVSTLGPRVVRRYEP